ncbi:MAG: hypothetical protein MUO27_03540 [Sedimentisphaerales bacterium]|nr:hypothetical protein [Sedimentisphaerales bacterium]
MGDFHNSFLRDSSIVINCPKLDDARFYIEKLADILWVNKIKGLTVEYVVNSYYYGLTRIAGELMVKVGQKNGV